MQLPLHEIEFIAIRSRGPGGQNVNRTNSAIQLRWNLLRSTFFSAEKKELLIQRLAQRLTSEGEIIIRNDEFRDQEMNRSACLQKLKKLLQAALFVAKKRVATKPSRSSKEKRLQSKKISSSIKKNRLKKRYQDVWD